MNTEIKKPTKVKWNVIAEVGTPPKELYFQDEKCQIERAFLVKGEYSLQVAFLYHDGSGFDMPEGSMDTPVAWAVVEGF